MMIGAPESGKTSYLARLWQALRGGEGRLQATQTDDDVTYVIDALTHLLQGEFAPRTETGAHMDRKCTIDVAWERDERTRHAQLVVPDVNGELWEEAMETNELPEEWMAGVRGAVGALLFVRVLSPLNKPALDLVTARELLQLDGSSESESSNEARIPTDVQLCEFLRFLEFALGRDSSVAKPRVAVMVTAWDMVDKDRAKAGPRGYLGEEFPLFDGRLDDISDLEVGVFGVSAVGGDFRDDAFKQRFLAGDIEEFGYVATEPGADPPKEDVAAPVHWILNGTVGR